MDLLIRRERVEDEGVSWGIVESWNSGIMGGRIIGLMDDWYVER